MTRNEIKLCTKCHSLPAYIRPNGKVYNLCALCGWEAMQILLSLDIRTDGEDEMFEGLYLEVTEIDSTPIFWVFSVRNMITGKEVKVRCFKRPHPQKPDGSEARRVGKEVMSTGTTGVYADAWGLHGAEI